MATHSNGESKSGLTSSSVSFYSSFQCISSFFFLLSQNNCAVTASSPNAVFSPRPSSTLFYYGPLLVQWLTASVRDGHGHGHGHGVFILATPPAWG